MHEIKVIRTDSPSPLRPDSCNQGRLPDSALNLTFSYRAEPEQNLNRLEKESVPSKSGEPSLLSLVRAKTPLGKAIQTAAASASIAGWFGSMILHEIQVSNGNFMWQISNSGNFPHGVLWPTLATAALAICQSFAVPDSRGIIATALNKIGKYTPELCYGAMVALFVTGETVAPFLLTPFNVADLNDIPAGLLGCVCSYLAIGRYFRGGSAR